MDGDMSAESSMTQQEWNQKQSEEGRMEGRSGGGGKDRGRGGGWRGRRHQSLLLVLALGNWML